MCGFDLRMKNQTGGISMDNPQRSMWTVFENIFTNKNRWIDNPDYMSWLRKYTDIERDIYGYNEEYKNEFYQRRWTKPIFLYGTMYNEADVALAPLKAFRFNSVKSQLKVIEAGVHQMPVIASNFGPYTIDVIDGKHGYLIDEDDKKGWYEKMKFFTDNPNAVKEMGMALNELVLEKYTLQVVNKKRSEFLKSIVD
jgi:glycosyltransferase involved in cell wall biosynthesis